ncbi:heterogeneous nuclear ribonucleoprotein A1 isoform X1 [Cylas formicarius]|uniref:heterogeneous nuclear ribonucleoprotein A1 isoform X1 n=1 Tax=Cylas formicarius TaxID=197179 RepID=UPI002958C062|nr:heterogeneous nuclear ribonucleoprotein A1 isoform X1 [Cylas formicarius]
MQYFAMVFLFSALFVGGLAGYSASDSENELGQGTGGSTSYGYSGSYSGAGIPNGNTPIPFFPQWDFSGYLSKYFESLSKHHLEFMKELERQAQTALAQAQAQGQGQAAQGHPEVFSLGNRGGFVGGYGGGFAGPDGSGFSFAGPIGGGAGTGPGLDGSALASGSIGPGGVQQTAAVFPENPNAPNINTRFGSEGGDGSGFKSVFTSSKSVTTNVDGKPQTFREASTTVNDNGKVTTYTAKNP